MAVSNANTLSLNAASTNIPTGSYVQLSASCPIASANLIVVNTTTSTIRIGLGASGNEVAVVAVGPSSTSRIVLQNLLLQAGTRVALEAVDTAATSGYVVVSLL